MSETIKKIQSHYASAISGDLMKYHCKEWNSDLYYRKTYPFKEEAKVIELQSQGKTVEALCQALVNKARDKNGNKLFSQHDIVTLMNEADPAVIIMVASVINSGMPNVSIEDIAKE